MLETSRSDRKKIGVLTFHRCINYGSYWQARCLVEGLRARGHDAVILDHISSRINAAEWRVALRPTLPTPVPRSDIEQYACKTRKFLTEFERLPLSAQFDIDCPQDMPDMDTVVIGSDEVWNLHHPWYSSKPAFFGIGLNSRRTIAYAASFGNYSCWNGIGEPWTDYLKHLDAISVRDENSWWMLKNGIGRETPIVLDPCLQFPHRSTATAECFALVYGHNFSPEFASQVRAWADARGLKLLSFGYRNDWADVQWLDGGPLDFVEVFGRAQAVATNFFHGCVFSLVNDRPFACEISDYRSIKVRGLMELLDIKDHLSISVDQAMDTPISEAVHSRIRELRDFSNAYLDRTLEENYAGQIA